MPRRYKSVEAALAKGVMQADSALDAAKIWVWMMRDCRHDDPALAVDAPLLLAGLTHFNEDLVVSPAAVDAAIDRAAAIASSRAPHEQALADWDAAEDWRIGKQGYRFDAAAILIGIGLAASAGAANASLNDAAVEEMLNHLVRQGAIDDSPEDRATAAARERESARRVVEYLTAAQ
ncbi:hypothetical protein [Prescottella agglutinans]|uniref:Uncharacterized protein n=1 Tax=Prescottella agglutinans TaxID=1644129 RepID=A0ABT6MJ38_9NOCA|nr:hypothetical protein [Prescottella agglutinans]MDH6284327.1 hypothetical protein [Prescottella agglutinans]